MYPTNVKGVHVKKRKQRNNPVNVYLFKVNNRNTRERWEICSKLTIKTSERRQWRRSGVFVTSFSKCLLGKSYVKIFLIVRFFIFIVVRKKVFYQYRKIFAPRTEFSLVSFFEKSSSAQNELFYKRYSNMLVIFFYGTFWKSFHSEHCILLH